MTRKSLLLSLALSSLSAFAQISLNISVPTVRVNLAPPPIRVEVVPERPSPRHIWIPGHWTWRGDAHVWISGWWAVPPAPNYVWEPARWTNVGGGVHEFIEGHWRVNVPPIKTYVYQPPVVEKVIVSMPPPPVIAEVRGNAPYPGWVWIGGHWQWNGSAYVWVGGHWSGSPRQGAVWVHAHWEKFGPGWQFHSGHWD